MAGDSLAGSLGEVPAKDVAVIAKAASEDATKWLKRNNVEAGAGTLAYAGTLLKVSTSSDQRTRTGIFILIASGGTVYIEPLSSKVIASDTDALIKLYQQSDAPERRTSMSEYVELSFADKIKLPQQFGGPATTVTRTLVDDTELNRFVSVSHVDKRALAAINNAVYQVLLDKIVVGERPREEIMRLVDGLPGLATATNLFVALYSKVSGADPDLQERAYEELARTPLLAGGFGREAEQVLAEFKQLWHAVMWLNERRDHKAKTHHELHQLLLEFIGTLEASIRERVRRESEALCSPRAAPPPPLPTSPPRSWRSPPLSARKSATTRTAPSVSTS